MIKYPWTRKIDDPIRARKWAHYDDTDAHEFYSWARENYPADYRSLEAEIMDWADDITYAVHDLEDGYRVGLIPIHELVKPDESDWFLNRVERRWTDRPGYDADRVYEAWENVRKSGLVPPKRFTGSTRARGTIREFTSAYVRNYVRAIALNDGEEPSLPPPHNPGVVYRPREEDRGQSLPDDYAPRLEIDLLKELTWVYVIENPEPAAQQAGQRNIIRDLFKLFVAAADPDGSEGRELFPPAYRDELDAIDESLEITEDQKASRRARLVVDLVSSLTELQAIRLHNRLTGADMESVLYPIF